MIFVDVAFVNPQPLRGSIRTLYSKKNSTTTKVVKKDFKPICNPSQSLPFSTLFSHLYLQPTVIFFQMAKNSLPHIASVASTYIVNVDWPNSSLSQQ